jgi:nucleoredoxin
MAVPFEDRDRETALSTKFGVEGIPTFVVLDGATGALVDKEARAKVVAAKKLSGVFSK